MNPTHESEKMAQIWFETFQTPRLMGYLEPVLAVTSNGRTTALSVNLGGGLLQIVPIYEGHIISEAVIRKDFGGSDLTHYMAKMLMEDFRLERDFSSACIRDVEAIKDKRSYVAQDYELEMQGYTESSANFVEHVWEDGSKSLLSSQRIRCAEALFKPALLGLEHPGIHHLIYESILRCPVDIRSALYLNVGLNGGGTMIKGLAERLRRELDRLTPPNKGVKVYGAPERQFSAWTGGSIVASPNYMWWLLNWFTKEDYEEEGPWGIHRRGGLQWNIHDHLPSITR
jgi:actin